MDAALREQLARVEDRHWWFEGRRAILRSVLRQIGATGPLLEVGCGSGANLRMLEEFGDVVGIEPDPQDRERAAAQGIGRVEAGSFPNELPEGPYGCVLALDVIEHVDQDEESVRAMGRAARRGGHVVLTVPANPWMWSRHDVRNGHRRRYTLRSLTDLLERSGLVVERVTHFNSLLFLPVAFVRVAGRMIRLDAAGTGLPPAPVNAVLTKLLGSERRLLAHFDLRVGVSLLAIARPGAPH